MNLFDYVRRLVAMLAVAMPLTAVAITLWELRTAANTAESFGNILGGALVMVYLWGALTGTVTSLAHSYLVRVLPWHSAPPSILLGLLLGAAAGAVTPTALSGFLERNTILWGAFTGLIYALFVWYIFPVNGVHGSAQP